MNREEPNPASAKEEDVSSDCNRPEKCADDEFTPKIDLPGKTDSGPEPDVFGSEIPPQD
jgi:hypothetical protein